MPNLYFDRKILSKLLFFCFFYHLYSSLGIDFTMFLGGCMVVKFFDVKELIIFISFIAPKNFEHIQPIHKTFNTMPLRPIQVIEKSRKTVK